MKRFAAAAVAAFALLVAPAASYGAAGDYAKGRGTTISERFSFLAQGTGLADRANGSSVETLTIFDPNITIKGDVTCMIIIGKDAFIGGIITDVKPAGAEAAIGFAKGFAIFAEDNAKPSNGLDMYGYETEQLPVTDCTTITSAAFFENVITGDIEIIPGM